jgi:hypothetical protein
MSDMWVSASVEPTDTLVVTSMGLLSFVFRWKLIVVNAANVDILVAFVDVVWAAR